MSDTIFDKIVRGEISCHRVWEDDKHLAFLTPFANTPGQTVVIPKTNPGDYVFAIDGQVYQDLMAAVKTVASKLEKAFAVHRVAMVFEGTGVPYVHAKLYPLHGDLSAAADGTHGRTEFAEDYRGYITTVEGPKMDDSRLKELQEKITNA